MIIQWILVWLQCNLLFWNSVHFLTYNSLLKFLQDSNMKTHKYHAISNMKTSVGTIQQTWRLVVVPILKQVEYENGELVIVIKMVDTSLIAIGWAVGQYDERENRFVIWFGAKIFTERQRAYLQTYKELWWSLTTLKANGHRGVWATYTKIKERYWWKSLCKDVEEFLASCITCQLQS